MSDHEKPRKVVTLADRDIVRFSKLTPIEQLRELEDVGEEIEARIIVTDIKKRLADVLDGDVPDDVPHWIVEFHDEVGDDECDLTPLTAAEAAYREIEQSRYCTVSHTRSGLMWDVNLKTGEVIEIVRIALPTKAAP
jgi:hypothetical protein